MRIFLMLCLVSLMACEDNAIDADLPAVSDYKYSLQMFGDSREGPDIYASLLNLSSGNLPRKAVIHLGDIISSPSDPDQYAVFDELSKQYVEHKNLYVTVGNHDVNSVDSLRLMSRVFPYVGDKGYYAQRLGGCFCLFLNSEDPIEGSNAIRGAQLEWLKQQLASAEAQGAAYRMILLHRPLFPQSHHKDEPLLDNEALHKLFVDQRVTIVAAGHEHAYSHQLKDGIHYVISGGAGSQLFSGAGKKSAFYHFMQVYEMNDGSLKFFAIDFLGRVRDAFQVDKPLGASVRPQQTGLR
jgi:predicted phosphodiesterase